MELDSPINNSGPYQLYQLHIQRFSTWYSQAVTHQSTDPVWRCLISLHIKEQVFHPDDAIRFGLAKIQGVVTQSILRFNL